MFYKIDTIDDAFCILQARPDLRHLQFLHDRLSGSFGIPVNDLRRHGMHRFDTFYAFYKSDAIDMHRCVDFVDLMTTWFVFFGPKLNLSRLDLHFLKLMNYYV